MEKPLRLGLGGLFVALIAFAGVAQVPSTVPPDGLRENTPAVHALTNARIVPSPGNVIERGTVVVRDGVVVAVGADVGPPPDARVWDMAGKTIYPGLIDAYGEMTEATTAPAARTAAAGAELLRTAPAAPEQRTGAAHWNARVTAQYRVDHAYVASAETNQRLRGQGIVARLVAPSRNIVKGTSAAVTTGDGDASRAILRPVVAMHVQLMPGGAPGSERGYPVSPMGAVALVRQAMYDGRWYAAAHAAWDADRSLPRPEANDALLALQPALRREVPVVIDAPDEQYALRADRIGKEFDLDVILRGSGQEYRRLDEIKATNRTLIVPVNFARPPNVAAPESALAYSLEELMDWDLQPENPARLSRAGVRFALTSHGLRDKATFLPAVRRAVARGLPPAAALAALTTTPAELLGLTKTHGTIEPGKSASFVVTDGELFDEKTKVLETWVDGTRHEIASTPKEDVRGTWSVELGDRKLIVKLTGEANAPRGRLLSGGATRPTTRPGGRGSAGPDLANLAYAASRLTFTMKDGPGVTQLSATVIGDEWVGSATRPDGSRIALTATRTAPFDRNEEPAAPDPATDGPSRRRSEPPPGEREQPTTQTTPPAVTGAVAGAPTSLPSDLARQAERASTRPALFDVNYPLGAFGRRQPPEQPPFALFRNVTVWTNGPRGKVENASVLIGGGRIIEVAEAGVKMELPAGTVVIDGTGKHLTPGIIDCHSHIATDGGVNEGSQSITCEVRIGDFVDPDDVNIYRQLAGGVTAANVLHGSANTIGGQNQVIKLRWGAPADGLRFAEAPPGVKFALGENVKRSNSEPARGVVARYPVSRMGVEQIVGDAFAAARDYQRQWDEHAKTGRGIPPRRDLELDALVEIVTGRRMIHCHSYRQDEILALIRTCDRFGVKVAVFQHVLEGYKVADAIARHGAAGSTFSDWWAYKFEVWDAIPYNGALMNRTGVNVSFNSDDAELARRLNVEAAKAVRYGGVPEEEALKFVTLNPARQLKVDRYVGSIEPGKHADVVLWSGPPLSSLSRCEQTWVDGRRYFDREEDRRLREEAQSMRAALVQKILSGGERMSADGEEPDPRPRTLWRHSEDCRACDCGELMSGRR